MLMQLIYWWLVNDRQYLCSVNRKKWCTRSGRTNVRRIVVKGRGWEFPDKRVPEVRNGGAKIKRLGGLTPLPTMWARGRWGFLPACPLPPFLFFLHRPKIDPSYGHVIVTPFFIKYLILYKWNAKILCKINISLSGLTSLKCCWCRK